MRRKTWFIFSVLANVLMIIVLAIGTKMLRNRQMSEEISGYTPPKESLVVGDLTGGETDKEQGKLFQGRYSLKNVVNGKMAVQYHKAIKGAQMGLLVREKGVGRPGRSSYRESCRKNGREIVHFDYYDSVYSDSGGLFFFSANWSGFCIGLLLSETALGEETGFDLK